MDFNIAGHNISIIVQDGNGALLKLLPSFRPFITTLSDDEPRLLRLTLLEHLKQLGEDERRLIKDVDTGNGMIRVDRTPDGRYQFLVRDIGGQSCALLITSSDFTDCHCAIRGSLATRRFALNSALMLAYAFAAASYDTLLIHASVVRHSGIAYAFTAKSGTGKSTQVANWMRYIEGCDIMNDDNPILRLSADGAVTLYGSPWSGKTPCYRNIHAPLGALVKIERADANSVTPQPPLDAFITLLTACSAMRWDEDLYKKVCKTVSGIVERTKVVTLNCLPDADSALTCQRALEG